MVGFASLANSIMDTVVGSLSAWSSDMTFFSSSRRSRAKFLSRKSGSSSCSWLRDELAVVSQSPCWLRSCSHGMSETKKGEGIWTDGVKIPAGVARCSVAILLFETAS